MKAKHYERNEHKKSKKRELLTLDQKEVKLERAQGECLGIRSRRRTWQTAKSCGES